MDPKIRNEQGWLITGSLTVLAIVAASVALSLTREFMVPFVLAVFLASMISPVVDYQVLNLRLPHWLAVVGALLIVLAFMVVVGIFSVGAVQTIVDKAAAYSDSIKQVVDDAAAWIKTWDEEFDTERIGAELQAQIPRFASQTAGTALQLVSRGSLVFIFVVFLLAGRDPHRQLSGVYAQIDTGVRQYIATKVALSVATGVLVWASLWLFGLEMASLFGVLACLLNFIPSVGSIVATLLPIPVAIAQFNNPWMILGAVLVPGAIQMTIGNGIEPKMMGKGLDLHPVTILLALGFWGLLWGLVGMILAVPITASLRIVLMHFEITQPIGNALAGTLPGSEQDAPSTA